MKIFILHTIQFIRNNRITLFVALFLFLTTTTYAQQTDYFWNNTTKVYLNRLSTKKYITFDKTINDSSALKQVLSLPNAVIQGFGELTILTGLENTLSNKTTEDNWAIIESVGIGNSTLSTSQFIISESPVYLTPNNEELNISHLFYVKLNNQSDFQILENLTQQNNIEIIGNNKYMPLWYILSCDKNSGGNALQMANLFHETGLFTHVQPDFMIKIESSCGNDPLSDPLFPDQWGLENTGQHNSFYTGIDIKLCQAHQITKGNSDIVVAVIDRGIEMTHTDLTNIYPMSFNIETQMSPSQISGIGSTNHGTAVAGIIGANNNNGVGLTGIAPDCPLMSISSELKAIDSPGKAIKFANGVNFAWQNGADVINNSYYISVPIPVPNLYLIDDAFTDAMTKGRNGLGCVVVFASTNNNSTFIQYPTGLHPDIIVVGAMSPCGERWNISSCSSTTTNSGSNYSAVLDVVAPGDLIPTTDLNNGYMNFSATSAAAPHVAGIAALILSVNPGLSQQQVGEIIETTAQKVRPDLYNYQITPNRPNGTRHQEVGYGLVDANAAVLMAQSLCSNQVDLFTKDSKEDFGLEPNTSTGPYIWLSDNMWVRRQPDGLINQIHQDAKPDIQNYVYVRVINKSCEASLGTTETLSLYWAKAATSLAWPTYWNGSLDFIDGNLLTLPNVLAGNVIGTQNIPIIPPGGETILEFPWNPPFAEDYTTINTEPWHFCLLSRIVATNDPMTFSETSNIGENVRNNNNIAWKNISVLSYVLLPDCENQQFGNNGVVAVANPFFQPTTFNIDFSVPEEELNFPITKEGSLTLTLDDELYNKWKQGGKKGTGFKEILSPPMSENGIVNNNINGNAPIISTNRKQFELLETNVSFQNITLAPNEYRTTSLKIQYPKNDIINTKEWYNYDVVQRRSDNDEIIGGVRYTIQKPDCKGLNIDAGNNQTIKRGCTGVLLASISSTPQIGQDCSSYQWFNDKGNLVSEQSAVKITPTKTTTYTVKYTSTAGCISEDQVTITVLNQLCNKERKIIKISPNPADDFITIDYKALNTTNAHIRLLKTDNSIDQTFPLDLQVSQKTINVSNYTFGSYVVLLICDGVNEDSDIVIIQ